MHFPSWSDTNCAGCPTLLPSSLCWVPVRPQARTLGITFANPLVHQAQQQQQQRELQQQQQEHLALLHNEQAAEWAALRRLSAVKYRVCIVQGSAQAELYARFDRMRGGQGGGLTRRQHQQLSQAEEREDEALSARNQAERKQMGRQHDSEKHSMK